MEDGIETFQLFQKNLNKLWFLDNFFIHIPKSSSVD